MSIKVYSDRIEFGNYTLSLTPDGININGALSSESLARFGLPGEVASYVSGGVDAPPFNTGTNTIQRYSFAADIDTVSVGTLSATKLTAAGSSSPSHGFDYGGNSGGTSTNPPATMTMVNAIDRFSFASFAPAVNLGSITATRSAGGHSSREHGYVSGGLTTPTSVSDVSRSLIRYPFASAADEVVTANSLTTAGGGHAAQSSNTHGYVSGGYGGAAPAPDGYTRIDKFAFTASSICTDIGDLTQLRSKHTTSEPSAYSSIAGVSSAIAGYSAGGQSTPPSPSNTYYNTVDKFPFATDTNASDVGDLSGNRGGAIGTSSTTNGYVNGGYGAPANSLNYIDTFPFANDTSITYISNLAAVRAGASSQQI